MKEEENAALSKHLQSIWSHFFVCGDSLLLLFIYSVHLRLTIYYYSVQ